MDPIVVELREWSRMAEELKQERVRLTNRVRLRIPMIPPGYSNPGPRTVLI